MKRRLVTLLLAAALALLSGCAATLPIKVVATGAKVGVKTAKVGVKTTAKAADVLIPDGEQDDAKD